MQDDAETPRARLRLKPRHALLMLLPGLTFLVAHPLLYGWLWERAQVSYHPQTETRYDNWVSLRIGACLTAATGAGFAAITVLGIAAVMERKRTGPGDMTCSGLLLLIVLIIVVNGSLVFGGCVAGEHHVRDMRPPKPVKNENEAPKTAPDR